MRRSGEVMGPLQSINRGLFNAFKLSGRAQRSEHWWFVAAYISLLVVGLLTEIIVFSEWLTAKVSSVTLIVILGVMLIPVLTSTWRRLSDTKVSPFILFVLIVYPIAALPVVRYADTLGIAPHSPTEFMPEAMYAFLGFLFLSLCSAFLCALPSFPGPNKYGPNPHEALT